MSARISFFRVCLCDSLNKSPCFQDFKTGIRSVKRLPEFDLEAFEITQNLLIAAFESGRPPSWKWKMISRLWRSISQDGPNEPNGDYLTSYYNASNTHDLTSIMSMPVCCIVYRRVPCLVTRSPSASSLSVSNSSQLVPVNWNATQPQTFAQWRKHSTGLGTFTEAIVCLTMAISLVKML